MYGRSAGIGRREAEGVFDTTRHWSGTVERPRFAAPTLTRSVVTVYRSSSPGSGERPYEPLRWRRSGRQIRVDARAVEPLPPQPIRSLVPSGHSFTQPSRASRRPTSATPRATTRTRLELGYGSSIHCSRVPAGTPDSGRSVRTPVRGRSSRGSTRRASLSRRHCRGWPGPRLPNRGDPSRRGRTPRPRRI